MYKQKKKINRSQKIGIITFIVSLLLIGLFIYLVSTNTVITNNVSSAVIFCFVFGSLGLTATLCLCFSKA